MEVGKFIKDTTNARYLLQVFDLWREQQKKQKRDDSGVVVFGYTQDLVSVQDLVLFSRMSWVDRKLKEITSYLIYRSEQIICHAETIKAALMIALDNHCFTPNAMINSIGFNSSSLVLADHYSPSETTCVLIRLSIEGKILSLHLMEQKFCLKFQRKTSNLTYGDKLIFSEEDESISETSKEALKIEITSLYLERLFPIPIVGIIRQFYSAEEMKMPMSKDWQLIA